MIFASHRYLTALTAIGLCLTAVGCSSSEDAPAASSGGDSGAAVADAGGGPAGGEFGAPGLGDDYSDGNYDDGSGSDEGGHGGGGGGSGMAAAMGRGRGGGGGGEADEHGNSSGGMMAAMGGGYGDPGYGDGAYNDGGYSEGRGGPGMGMGGPGMGGPGMGAGGGSSLPRDFSQWTDDDYVTAAKEKNEAVVDAIRSKAEQSVGDPKFTDLMQRVLNESAGVSASPAGGMGFGFPGGFGGAGAGASSGAGIATPYKPDTKVPPGGAFLFPNPEQRLRSNHSNGAVNVSDTAGCLQLGFGMNSLEAMLAETLLGYTPQAASATRQRAEAMQAPGGMSGGPPGMQAPGGVSGGPPGMQAPGGMSGGPPGMQGPGGMSGGPPGMQGARGSRGGSPGMQGPGGQSGGPAMGNLSSDELVKAIVSGLVSSNTPQSWTLIDKIYHGQQPTPVSESDARGHVLMAVLQATEFDEAVVKSLLGSSLQSALAEPMQSKRTLEALTAAAGQTTEHYFKLSKSSQPALTGSPMNQGGGMGMAGSSEGMGMAGPGGGVGMGQPGGGPGMSGPGMAGPGMVGPGGGGNMGPGYDEGRYGGGNMGSRYGEGAYGDGNMGGGNRPPKTGPRPSLRLSPAMFPIIASVLWSESSTSALASALSAAGSLQAAEPLMPLAVSIPNDAVRKAVFEILETQYATGASGLISVGFFSTMWNDPGMLPVLKSMRRQRPARQTTGPNMAAAAPATPESTWTDGTKQAVLALRDRLRAAAGNPALVYDGGGPMRLHRGAVAQRSIRLSTLSDEFKEMGAGAPSSTTYQYMSCSIAPTSARQLEDILEHYEKKAKAYRRLNATQTMLWFDGMKTSTNGSRISIDVIIEEQGGRSGGGNYGGGGDYGGGGPGSGGRSSGSGQYQIEVMVVETRDPKSVLDEDPSP